MKILHTSDWHLGRSLHRYDLSSAHAAYFDHLLEVVRDERPHAVIVAGDIYDRAVPPPEAVELCNDVLCRIALGTGTPVIVISGNHDSPRRLGFGSQLISSAGVHLRTNPARCDEPILIAADDQILACYALAYLEPTAAPAQWNIPQRSHSAAIGAAMNLIRAHRSNSPVQLSVIVAHAFVTGGTSSDSERELGIGGVGQIPADLFSGFDYTALGHLHRNQRVSERIHYSGSPLAFSFSEAQDIKSTLLISLTAGQAPVVEAIPAPVHRQLSQVNGTLDELLTGAQWENYHDHWLHVTLTDHQRPQEPMQRLRQRFPHTLIVDVPVLQLAEENIAIVHPHASSVADIAADFIATMRKQPPNEQEKQLIATGLQALALEDQEMGSA